MSTLRNHDFKLEVSAIAVLLLNFEYANIWSENIQAVILELRHSFQMDVVIDENRSQKRMQNYYLVRKK